MEDPIQNNKVFNLGHVFKPTTRTASKILIVICVLGFYIGQTMDAETMSFAAVLICLVCIILLNYKSSVEINTEINKFRECGQLFFYKFGKWRNLSSYTDLAILTTRKKLEVEVMTIHSQNLVSTHHEKETAVYLLTASHRHRILIKVCGSYRVAESFAEEIAIELNKTYTVFSPKISKVSLDKRRR